MRKLMLSVVVAVAGSLAAGCFSYSTLHTATPVEEGAAEIKASTGAYRLDLGSIDTGDAQTRIAGILPTFEFHGRYGLGNNMDIGGKLYPIGAGIDFNYAFLNERNLAMSVNPSANFLVVGGAGGVGAMGTALLNVLADVVKTESVVFTVGAKPGAFIIAGAGGGGGGALASPLIGGTGGLTLNLGDNFALQPWFDGMYETTGQTFWWTGMLGFSFGVDSGA